LLHHPAVRARRGLLTGRVLVHLLGLLLLHMHHHLRLLGWWLLPLLPHRAAVRLV
jgi:hypothetical protein